MNMIKTTDNKNADKTCFQLSIIDLVESIYSSLDKTSRTFYWQRLQGERISTITFILFMNVFHSHNFWTQICSVHFPCPLIMFNLQGRSTSSWRTLTSTWRRRRAFSSLCSTSKDNLQPPISFRPVFLLLTTSRYFNYDELVQIKDTVMAQHSEWKERVGVEKSLKNLKRGRLEGDWLVEEVPQKSARGESPAQNLPKEASLL